MHRVPPRLALLTAAVLLPGCTTTVVGTASPGAGTPAASSAPESGGPAPSMPTAESAGPFDELRGQVSLSDTTGESSVLLDADGLSDGHVVAVLHMGRDQGFVVDLAPGPTGIEIADVLETPIGSAFASLHAAPDDTVVIDPGLSQDDAAYDVQVLDRGATQVESRPLDPPLEQSPTFHPSDLSPDGSTLFIGLAWPIEDAIPSRVLAVDLATGAVTAEVELPDSLSESDVIADLRVRPDGGPTVNVLNDPNNDGEYEDARPVVLEFDADLRPLGDPVELLGPDEGGRTRAMAIAPDGTALVVLVGSAGDEHFVRVVRVADGGAEDVADLDVPTMYPPSDAAVDPDGRFLYLPHGDGEQWVLSTLDLDSGELVASIPLCPIPEYGVVPIVVLAADAQTATVLMTCTENGLVSAFLVA
jgi:hypothetical protein